MSQIKVIVSGIKGYDNRKVISDILNRVKSSTTDLTIINSATKGVESVAKEWSEMVGVDYVKVPVEWKKLDVEGAEVRTGPYGEYNAKAGLAANRKMVEMATHLIVFWDGKDVGCNILINYAKKKGLTIKIFLVEGESIREQSLDELEKEDQYMRKQEAQVANEEDDFF